MEHLNGHVEGVYMGGVAMITNNRYNDKQGR